MKNKLISILTTVALCSSLIISTPITSNASATEYTSIELETVLTSENTDTAITLGDEILVEGEGVTINNNIVTITSSGTYNLSGTLSDGQLVVNSQDSDSVRILLNGVNISSSTSSAINIIKGTTVLTLAPNTTNTISDASSYIFEDEAIDEPDAAIFSKTDLVINGSGILNVTGNYNTGIRSKDALSIEGGTITVKSVDDGIKGKDAVTITDGNINITSGADGIKSTNTKASKGYIRIDGGNININSQTDGIQAESTLTINGGDISILSGNGSEYGKDHIEDDMPPAPPDGNSPGMNPPEGFNPGDTQVPQAPPNTNSGATNNGSDSNSSTEETTTVSSKGLKAETAIFINGGTFNINSADDTVHSNGNITINGGKITLETGDDALHADGTLEINSGTTRITKSYEGLEATYITINNGTIYVKSSDDGMNASVKTTDDETSTSSATPPGTPVEADTSNSTAVLTINGGHIVVDADGDGLDANGSIFITGGTTIVNGPTADNNGALDYDVKMDITGGTLIAAGSLGMAETPSTSSTQNVISVAVSSQDAGTLLHIENEDGSNIVTFAPSKKYSSVVVSSPNIKTGQTYSAYYGGSSTGTATDGLYDSGTYSKGTLVGSVTIESPISKITEEGVTEGHPGMGGPNVPGNGQTPPDKPEEGEDTPDDEVTTPDSGENNPDDDSTSNDGITNDDTTSNNNSTTNNGTTTDDSATPDDTSSSDSNNSTNSPTKTGDFVNLIFYGVTLSLSGILAIFSFKKKQIKN